MAHRDSYYVSDVDGKMAYEDGERIWKEMKLPAVLSPGVSSSSSSSSLSTSSGLRPYPPENHFLDTWKSYVPAGTDVRVSNDAGRYLCEFIFYTSLAQAEVEQRDRSVVFFHVPADYDDRHVECGKEAVIALIKTLVTCWVDEQK